MEGSLRYFNVMAPLKKSASTMAIAYLLHKLFLPLQAAVTITAVPVLVRWLRAKGIMKAPHQAIMMIMMGEVRFVLSIIVVNFLYHKADQC